MNNNLYKIAFGICLAIAMSFGWAHHAFADPAFVQINYNLKASVTITSSTLAFTNNTTAGNLIIVCVGWDGAANISTVTDTNNNGYLMGTAKTSGNANNQCYYAPNIVGGADTVKVTLTGNTTSIFELFVHEYSGIATVNPLDVSSTHSGTSATTFTTGTSTTNYANEMIFAHTTVSTGAASSGAGFASRAGGFDGEVSEDMDVTSTGSYSGFGTNSVSANYDAHMMIFRSAIQPGWKVFIRGVKLFIKGVAALFR